MKKVYIPVFSHSVRSKTFSLSTGNPGIGGTEFTTIRLALALATERPDWKIVLASYEGIGLEKVFPNVSQEVFEDVSDFFQDLSDGSMGEHEVVIATVSVLKRVDSSLIKRIENRLIAWSRHPFDIEAARLAALVTFKGIVCVGVYQFYSNKALHSHIHHIQNIFTLPPLNSIPPNTRDKYPYVGNKELNIVYLGALIPGKGFLELAKAWNQLKARFPGLVLHVIGSSATYGTKPEVKEIPSSADYAQEILEFIPKQDIHAKKVVFHGNLGADKFDIIQQCDLAILNPTGATEAFPASPLECMACGVPVIASDDYGMSDAMRFFPELVIDGHKNILEKVEWLVADPLRYREMQHRSVTVAQWFASQIGQIITRWIRLIESYEESSSHDIVLMPTMPFYGSKYKLLFRRDIKPRLSLLKRSGLKALRMFS